MNFKHPILNLPNLLTLIRMTAIPLLVFIFYLPYQFSHVLAAFIFVLASFTDWLDGYLARTLNLTTRLGAFLDPLADKLMVSTALVMLVAEPRFQFISTEHTTIGLPAMLLTIPAAIIVAREIIVSGLREWMAEIGKRASVSVSYLGKLKTTVQMFSLTVLLYCGNDTSAWIIGLGYLLLYFASVLTIWSMVIYLRAAFRENAFSESH